MIDDELQVYPHLDLDASSTANLARVREWMRRNRSADEWTADELVAAKRADGADRTISVVLPARDEQETVGDIVATIRAELEIGRASCRERV